MVGAERIREGSPNRTIVVVGLAFVAGYLTLLFYLMDRTSWDSWGAMLVGPVLFVATLPALARQARREGDRRVFWFLVAALSVKMAFSLFRWFHAFHVVEKADARSFDNFGTDIAERFLHGNFDPQLGNLYDTNFIRLFTGIVYTIIRPSVIAGFLIYAWLAFWGTFYFYRAFVLALPEGNRRSYARWLFFMPSILFWPSSIGKESWMMFGLGIAAFGAATMLARKIVPGLLIAAIGIGLAALVRAPIAALMGVGFVVGGLLRKPSHSLRQLGPIAKLATVVLFAGVLVVLGVTMRGYLARSGLGSSFDTVVAEQQRVTSAGGSQFNAPSITSPSGLALSVVTVLFRPFLFEANTVEAAVTSIEGSLLLLVVVVRFRSILAALRSVRRTPYVAVAVVYVAGSIVALSAVANFGIIARQRTLLYPMFFVLLCVTARRRVDEPSAVGAVPEPSVLAGART